MPYDKERAKGNQKTADYSGSVGFVSAAWLLWDENKPDIQAAGISEGLLFHYFPTKENLLEELVKIGVEGMRMPMQTTAENGLDFFYQFTKMLFENVGKNPLIAKMFVFMGHVVQAEDIPERIQRLAVSVDTIVSSRSMVEAGQRDGSIRKGDTMALSNMYWCAVHGIMEQYAVHPEIPLPEPEWVADMLRNTK